MKGGYAMTETTKRTWVQKVLIILIGGLQAEAASASVGNIMAAITYVTQVIMSVMMSVMSVIMSVMSVMMSLIMSVMMSVMILI